MTLAVRGIIELFRLVKREKELYWQILAFSISHDHSSVRIYGYYPLVDRDKTTFYRHPIHKFDFTAIEGKEKWTAYKFTKNVYDVWMPTHFERICSVIDNLPPDLDFEVSQQSEPGESGLSQGLESHHLSDQSSHDAASLLEDADSQSSHVGSRDITPDTSLSQRIEGGAFKKPRKRGRPVELHQWMASLAINQDCEAYCLLPRVSEKLYDIMMPSKEIKACLIPYSFFCGVSLHASRP
jgi:hypothetical protein